MAATLASAVSTWTTLDRIRSFSCDLAYQPLTSQFGATLFLLAASVPDVNTKTDLTRKSVGCTTRSASTLSAQFRWGHLRVRAFP